MDDDDDDRSSKILAKCPPPCQRCPNANCTTFIVHMKCTLHQKSPRFASTQSKALNIYNIPNVLFKLCTTYITSIKYRKIKCFLRYCVLGYFQIFPIIISAEPSKPLYILCWKPHSSIEEEEEDKGSKGADKFYFQLISRYLYMYILSMYLNSQGNY